MSQPKTESELLTAETRERLRGLRTSMLRLHKMLLDAERDRYQDVHGRKLGGHELLKLVLHDEWFAWLRPMSGLVVRIDELLEAVDDPATEPDGLALLQEARNMLQAEEDAEGFRGNYHQALQRDPAIVMAHAGVTRHLPGWEQAPE